MLFTWFNPGSGTGYVFAMLNLLGRDGWRLAAGLGGAWLAAIEHLPDVPEWLCFTVCVTGYVMGYLGIVRLAVVALRRLTPVGMLATFLCQVIVVPRRRSVSAACCRPW